MKNFIKFLVILLCFLTMFVIIADTVNGAPAEDKFIPNKISSKLSTEYVSGTVKVEVTIAQKFKLEEELKKYENEIRMLAKLIYREARGIDSKEQQAAVVWCVLNRVDSRKFPNSISAVIKQKHQFCWISDTPVWNSHYNLAKDVVTRWLLEKKGISEVGRTLPKGYLFFSGKNGRNYFRKSYRSSSYWNWSLESPYLEE